MDTPTPDPSGARRALRALAARLRAKDPGLAATRRAGRGAIVMPALFALCSKGLGSPTTASFAAFGAFSMLLLVDFSGPVAQRLRAHAALAVAWAGMICLGTAVSRVTWLGVTTMVVIGFLVLFSGIVSSVLAGATTALLLGFILPVSLAAPMSALPDRLAGAGLATAASMLAVTLLWPRPSTDPLSAPAAAVCRAVAVRLRVDAALVLGPDTPTAEDCAAAAAGAAAAAERLRRAFDSTPYRPTGLSTGARALVRLVDELTWLTAIAAHSGTPLDTARGQVAAPCLAKRAAAHALDEAADLLEGRHTDPSPLRAATEELSKALDAMEHDATTRLPGRRTAPDGDQEVTDFLSSLDVSFRAQELGFAVLQIASNVDLAAAAERRGWADRLLGREPGGMGHPLTAARERAAAHVDPHSVWLHNSVRGAAGLGLAVALTDVTTVQHSFWVVLGALSVLRSNALNTGQNAVRGLAGTVAGSIAGAALLQLIGHNSVLLWFLLPLAVLVAGIAPAAISFAAGQAAFTVTLVILFNIGQVPDWRVGLFRVEDIALGCAVSIVVGLFFWPRGASAAVGKAMAEAYADSADYLAGAVDYAVGCCTAGPEPAAAPLAAGRQAAAAARRLDDAFRSYLAERGPKPVPLAEMTTLVTGVVGLRLAADAVLGMWQRAGDAHSDAERAAARSELLSGAGRVSAWYHGLADGLDGHHPVPAPLPQDLAADSRLVEAVHRDLRDERGRATATAVRIIWTGDHLDAARRLQTSLSTAAHALP
ncbi:FUSC family protein [Actinacidiphila paucisporea]|uniref:Fusaric acid resistance protein-like n=1 Tax=Actinacidiphila paucisporea TaxID=310782 RepID=A0A1M7H0J5_9ACTN|nr:FUSC family protein [Actinacidiphila paucisporea]SHM21883.1 Fusaric acid resistance protein-like [Actinacidiphila paucisporea]